jgi:hypothetical protein
VPEQELQFAPDSSDGQPALHAIKDQELRDLMDRMNGLMMERFMTEHEIDIERHKYVLQIIQASETLDATAQTLLNKLPTLGLEPAEQTAFRNLAHKLGQQAHSLKNQAENRSFNGVSATLHEMRTTCMACHTLFRKL